MMKPKEKAISIVITDGTSNYSTIVALLKSSEPFRLAIIGYVD